MRTLLRLSVAVCFVGMFSGCAAHTRPVGGRAELSQAQRDFDALWQRTLEVLRRHNFRIDRQDRRAGVVTTRPMTGQYFLEFWRNDAVDAQSLAEGAIQTIYRSPKVTIAPPKKGSGYRPTVEVTLARSARRGSQITNTSQAYNLFTGRTRPGRPEMKSPRVVPLGRDAQLEKRLADQIATVLQEKPKKRVEVTSREGPRENR